MNEEKPKRKKRISPTALTLKYLRDRGMTARVVERWVKFGQGGGIRRDIFGADLMALTKDCIIGIQAGAGQHHAEKVRHAIAHPEVRLWLASPSRVFQVWTWSQRVAFNKDGGKRKKPRWTPRVTEIYLEDGRVLARPFVLAGNE